jgi:biotin-(acetyl-CoA carboxylase) ligase
MLGGISEGIADDGALLVRVGDHVERIISGELRWL